jgi:three-Cys-motif partner protein
LAFAELALMVDHEFGDQHTELKLSIIEKYLKFFTTALRGKFRELWYIDGFAGTGYRTIRFHAEPPNLLGDGEPARIERRRGSAKIAIDVQPRFDFLVFIENKPSYVRALEELRANHPDRRIVVVRNDANDGLKALIAANSWTSTRAVIFLDPYGMEVDWSTLETIAKTGAIDVWYLFSLSGFYRQATRDHDALDDDKRAALTRMLGTNAWERELYKTKPATDLFGNSDTSLRRDADVAALEAYAKARLETIFGAVLDPLPLSLHERPQRFSLFFCISSRKPAAIGLARKIGNHILKAGIAS